MAMIGLTKKVGLFDPCYRMTSHADGEEECNRKATHAGFCVGNDKLVCCSVAVRASTRARTI